MIFAPDCLADRRILVTGASSGLGREAAIQMARCGATVILAGRNEARLAETASALAGTGHETIVCDLSDAEAADAMLKGIVAEGGALHGVFHAAGESVLAPVRTTKARHLEQAFGAALFGAFGIARAASRKGALADGGSLVFMSSVSATRGRRGMAAYSATKAGVGGLVRTLAIELAPRGIRVNAIAAGAVETTMHADFTGIVSEEMVSNYRDLHLLGFGRPEDIGYCVVFLMSDASRWITGQDLPVDGGYTAR